MQKHKPILIVQGAQWGSEAKGAVAAFLCKHKQVNYAVRTGAVNAGHTVYFAGKPYKMQQLPTGWVQPQTKLVLGAGTFIHPQILASEIAMVSEALGEDIRSRLLIDHRCSLHLPEHTQCAADAGDHVRFGATGKGVSKALIDKIKNRGNGYKLFREWAFNAENRWWRELQWCDTVDLLHSVYDNGERLLLEGTQGTLLDLHLGPYPYTTCKQTTAAQWCTEAGLSPAMEYEVALVARTYPIRVAGNSGPMTGETTWSNLARSINRKLMNHRMQQLVRSFAIDEFEQVWIKMAIEQPDRFPRHRDGSVNYDTHKWTAEDRVKFAETLSSFPQQVIKSVTLRSHGELMNLFETTTVTNKLRRVANWCNEDVAWAAKINRASYLVLTFFNYMFPETWNQTRIDWDKREYVDHIAAINVGTGCPVKYVSTGPESQHIIELAFKRRPVEVA